MGRKWRVLTALLLGFALVAGACGSDDEEAAPAATTAAPAATTAAPAATTAAPAAEEVASGAGDALGDGSLGTVEVAAGEDIQIRALHAISGDVAFLGIPMTRGVEMAVSDYGDIGGHGVNVGTWLDDLCSSDGGQAAAQTIVADESVVGVLGTSCSGAATAAAPLITGSGMVLVSGSNTSPALTSDLAGTAGANYSTGYYRTAHNDLYQGAAAAKFAVEVLGISSAAAIHDGDPYTEGLATAFADAFAALGGDVTAVTAVNKGDTDMVPVLTEVAAGSPEMLFFPIFMPEGGFIVQQVGEVSGLGDVVLMGADGLISENFMALPESEGVFMSGPDLDFAGNSNQATGQTGDGFLEAYEAEHGETPAAPFWGHAYDATTMLLDAISAASYDDGGTLVIDRAGVREYLNSISGYSGIIGVLTCDDFGDCGSQRISVIQHNDSSDWQAGTANVVFTYNPASSAQVGDIAAAAEVKAAFIYVGPVGDAGWTWAHDQGRQFAAEATGVETAFVEMVPEGTADFGNYVRDFIGQGYNVIFGTSFGYMDDMLALADEYPDVVFEHISGYKANDTNFGNTFGRMYEPRYLSGMVAGSATSSNLIGYVAAFPIPEGIRGINAFTLGVREVNPDAQVEVNWTSTWFDPAVEGDAAQALLDKGADVIAMHQDSTAAGEKAEAAGARWVSYNSDMSAFAPDAYLTAPVWNWGPRYVEIIEAAQAGTYTPGYYWGSMADGVVDLAPIAADVDSGVTDQVLAAKEAIIAGDLHPFTGPLYDQAGNLVLGAGEVMDDGTMLGMDFFVEGVVGSTG